jgi:hypothetical protein
VAGAKLGRAVAIKELFVGSPSDVASAQSLTFYVGNPPRQMQIFSGIAIPNWDSQLRLDFEDVRIHFNVSAPDGNYPDDWGYTATVSLAHIDSADNDFTFLTDQCKVVKADDGELQLIVTIAVLGEPAHLVRFSYHVEVLSNIPVQGTVFGSIRWNKFFGTPSVAVGSGAPMFKVGPATYWPGAPLGGVGGPAGWIWDGAFTIDTSTPPTPAGDYFIVPYAITGLPLNQPLTIRPDLLPGTLDGPPATYSPNPSFAPDAVPVTLTASAPSAVNVDFEMTFASEPA